MAKRTPKPPFKPLQDYHEVVPGIGLIQEKLIGRFVVEFSKLEAGLNDMIWLLLDLDMSDGRVLTQRSDATTKINILRAIVPRYLEGKDLETTLEALTRLDDVRDDRNFIIHGTWGSLHPTGVAIALSLRAKSETPDLITAETFPHARMRKLINSCLELNAHFKFLYDKLKA